MPDIALTLEANAEGKYVYFPGHVLRGNVTLSLNSVKKFRGFYIKLYGHAKAHWSKKQGKTTVHYEGKEIYLNSRTYFFGEHGGPSVEIQPGVHKYKFFCPLPDGIPYSMSVNHGDILYYIQAVLDIPWAFDEEIKIPITIVRYEDLNLYPQLRAPMKFEEVKTFFSLFSESKPLCMTARIPYSGFAVGQDVPIRIDYRNQSSVAIIGTKITLQQVITFTSKTPSVKTKVKEYDITSVVAAGVQAGNSNDTEAILKIPPVMISNEKYCSVVTVRYNVKIDAETDGMHYNAKIIIPIVIGSAPIRFDNSFNQPVMPSGPIFPSAPPQMDYDLPPSYNEALVNDIKRPISAS